MLSSFLSTFADDINTYKASTSIVLQQDKKENFVINRSKQMYVFFLETIENFVSEKCFRTNINGLCPDRLV